jgi:pimeloyl-ACP methyl ester carboxylesterase
MAVDLRYDDQVSNQPVVIFVHGFKGFKDWGHFPMVGEELVKAGFAFVSFNFTHDGTTLDQPTEFADLEAFGNNNYNKELFDTEQIMQGVVDGTLFPGIGLKRTQMFMLGHSRGGGISITKAAENPLIKGLATWGSIADMKRSQADLEEWRRDGVVFIPNSRTNQEMPMYYQFVEDYFAREERYDLRISCRKINVPGLFVHGTNDATVPLSDAENLAKWCSTGRALIIENGDHTFGGKHPFQDEVLPESSKVALSATIDHFKNVI